MSSFTDISEERRTVSVLEYEDVFGIKEDYAGNFDGVLFGEIPQMFDLLHWELDFDHYWPSGTNRAWPFSNGEWSGIGQGYGVAVRFLADITNIWVYWNTQSALNFANFTPHTFTRDQWVHWNFKVYNGTCYVTIDGTPHPQIHAVGQGEFNAAIPCNIGCNKNYTPAAQTPFEIQTAHQNNTVLNELDASGNFVKELARFDFQEGAPLGSTELNKGADAPPGSNLQWVLGGSANGTQYLGLGTYENEDAKTQTKLYNRIQGYIRSGVEISSPALEVLARFPNALTPEETYAITEFVDAMHLNGCWDLLDEFGFFPISDEANALTGWKLKTATAMNGATHGAEGYSFDRASLQYIDTNIGLLSDCIRYQKNNENIGLYLRSITPVADYDTLMGGSSASEGGGNVFTRMFHYTNRRYFNLSTTTNMYTDGAVYESDKTYQVQTTQPSTVNGYIYKDGLLADTKSKGTVYPVNDVKIWLSAHSPIASSYPLTSTISAWWVGAAFTATQVLEWHLALRTLLNRFGVYSSEATDVFNNLPNPLEDEEKYLIAEFVDAQVRLGVWSKKDDLFCGMLKDPTNAITGWKSGIQYTQNGTMTKMNKGWKLDGSTGWIRVPSGVPKVQYVNQDAHISLRMLDIGAANNYFQRYHANAARCYCYFSSDQLFGILNAPTNTVAIDTFMYKNGTPYTVAITRVGNVYKARINGTETAVSRTNAPPGSETPIESLPIGCRTVISDVPDAFNDLAAAIFCYGADLGSDYVEDHNQMTDLTSALVPLQRDWGYYDYEVQKVFDNMPNPLTDAEKVYMEEYITTQVANGNWDAKDDVLCPLLSDSVNALTGWKSGLLYDNQGGILTAKGLSFDGVSTHMKIPVGAPANEYAENDAHLGVWITEDNPVNWTAHFGKWINTDQYLYMLDTGSNYNGYINQDGGAASTVTGIKDDAQIYVRKIASTQSQTRVNDSDASARTVVDALVTPDGCAFGGNNKLGTMERWREITIGIVSYGSHSGMDYAQDRIDNRQLLYRFGVYSKEVLDVFARFPNPLTGPEEAAIAEFIQISLGLDNWDRMKSFHFFGLLDEENARTDWVTGITATKVGTPVHHANGFRLGGSPDRYLDTGIDQASMSGLNSDSLNEGVWIHENYSTSTQYPFGALGSGSENASMAQVSGARLTAWNWTTGQLQYTGETAFANRSLYHMYRGGGNATYMYKNGTSLISSAAGFTGYPDANTFVGKTNGVVTDGLDADYTAHFFASSAISNTLIYSALLTLLKKFNIPIA